MFGSNYYRHPEILLQSLHEMNSTYTKNIQISSALTTRLSTLYIRLFGIPEIGFQVRGMYFRDALRSLGRFSPKKILDIGSGIGCYAFYMAKTYPKASVVGFEIDKSKLTLAKELLNEFDAANVTFQFSDIVKNSKDTNMYDFVTIIDVLEHIKDYKIVFNNIYRLLKPKGFVYIHVPQIKQKRIFQKFSSWEHSDHVREGFDLQVLSADLKKIGFRVVDVKETFGFFGSLAWELNHLALEKNQWLTALIYPFLYVLSLLDGIKLNNRGLGLSLLSQKI